jgi:hypothetical protein
MKSSRNKLIVGIMLIPMMILVGCVVVYIFASIFIDLSGVSSLTDMLLRMIGL